MKHNYSRRALESVCEMKFTRTCKLTYGATDSQQEQQWEMVQRTTRTIPFTAFAQSPAPLPVDAVEICPILTRGGERFVILVAQYRPPLDAITLEFPAGLVDEGEDPREATIRELHEETGYLATVSEVLSISAPICPEPGLSDTCCCFVRVAVNGDRDENKNPPQHLDAGEDIEVILLPFSSPSSMKNELESVVRQKRDAGHRVVIDAKLYTFAESLSIAW